MEIRLKNATLIKRYKRFLADVQLSDGQTKTIHCANTGAMTGCATPNNIVWYSTSDNIKRKYPCSWELTQTSAEHFICVNTQRANQLVEEALLTNKIKQLNQFNSLNREVKYGNENSKIDFFVVDQNNANTYIEVKSVTLLENDLGYFPDTVSTRGQKHLRELIEQVEQGNRAVLFFAVLHSGINSVQAAVNIDIKYAQLLQLAYNKGVEIIAYKASYRLTNQVVNIHLRDEIPVIFMDSDNTKLNLGN
tara:strand:- start:86 stop:832 length:747 start_codon:yes stop_codon:yes gene_type:complete